MAAYIQEWLGLLLRWGHMIAGIAWIGASFYFVWLEGNLDRRPDAQRQDDLAGHLWAVHGGGFYYLEKYQVAPKQLPPVLHWFKWEAYTTWITGILLLFLLYYINPQNYLLDTTKADISAIAAIALGVASLIIGWVVYDLLCRTRLLYSPLIIGAVMYALIVATTYLLTLVLSDRAAFIHIGAMIGTIMVGNVFFVIIPAQKALVHAAERGEQPDGTLGQKAGLRSLHNNYFTLPVLFIMISSHFPSVLTHQHNWLLLAGIAFVGIIVRHFFNMKNRGNKQPWMLVAALVLLLLIAALAAPRTLFTGGSGNQVTFAQAQAIVQQHCVSCHAVSPTDTTFTSAPNGFMLDTPSRIKQGAALIYTRAVLTQSMPLGNKTGMTEEERAVLGAWIDQGAAIQ